MGDPKPTLETMMKMFLDEQAVNKAKQDELNRKLEALTLDLASVKEATAVTGSSTQERTSKAKGPAISTGSETQSGNSIFPKVTKLDFPKYNGLEDPMGWISQCEHFFRHQQTPEEEKVQLASYNLVGVAQPWYMQFLDDVPNPTWTEFKEQCNIRFGPSIRSNKLGELAKLKQTGSVADYQNQFEILVARAGSLTRMQKVQLYISGLQEYIAVEVELHHPTDLATAMSMSRLYERKQAALKQYGSHENKRTSAPSISNSLPARMVKRLTRAEMEERRQRGLCFNCEEPFVRGHQCKRLFWLDLVEEDDDMDLSNDCPHDIKPEISLNAITGIGSPQSMKLEVNLNGQKLLVLWWILEVLTVSLTLRRQHT